ncbi:hypothetical protein N7468_003709 [Penicillium chermesinum]|uniref:Uncharacterized protein n=1 Tax=Penicillium chermesinum TaxID=63820 RepID=A0A9W9P751_9EURO|nr:uncharacterized protein N7468_003709 [Penicillium chermesinum]KAJ5239090.1 hypothetical protein N7468_003709 [Penicillium chermesinum]
MRLLEKLKFKKAGQIAGLNRDIDTEKYLHLQESAFDVEKASVGEKPVETEKSLDSQNVSPGHEAKLTPRSTSLSRKILANQSLGMIYTQVPFDKSIHRQQDKVWDCLEGQYVAKDQMKWYLRKVSARCALFPACLINSRLRETSCPGKVPSATVGAG